MPEDYKSDTYLTRGATWSGSFVSLGLTPGTYRWTWETAADQSFTIDVRAPSPATVPDPSSIALLGAGELGLLGFLRRSKTA